MNDAVPNELAIHPEQVSRLPANERSRVLNFLLRWHASDKLLPCLDVLLKARPELVSLMDLKARALATQGDYEAATAIAERRLERNTSIPALTLLADLHIASSNLTAAERIAARLIEDDENSYSGWRIRAQVALLQGDLDAAAAANHRLGEIRPQGQRYLLSMMSLYQARNDWVTASGYAVRLLNTVERAADLAVPYLEALLAYFEASREQTRVVEIREALQARFDQELAEVKEILEPLQPAAGIDKPREAPPIADRPVSEAEAPTTKITVSDEERASINEIVRTTFGFEQLLPGQLETIACVLRGENALTVLPTGGGKSLCYQAPALAADRGLTVVISPLIALMKDQVDSLPPRLRPLATTINSTLDGDKFDRRMSKAARGDYRLLYAAPERLRQPAFLHTLKRGDVKRLVVDEAHCVSVWGHDFRPDYLKLREAWHGLGKPPILALTATAPPRVRRDIIQHLSPDRPMAMITGDTFRPNLRFEVFSAANRDEKIARMLAFCEASEGSGIVYADTRARCEQLAQLLQSRGVSAEHYHAGISNRDEVQERFMDGRTRIIVATIAFGMGIDKADIRFILHFIPPKSLESYYQEAGRAGRDGKPARCLLMYSPSDKALLTLRMRRSLPTVEFLREIYAAVLRHLGPESVVAIPPGDMERELRVEDTHVRVGLSILEENGLLVRGPDIPRSALVCIRTPTGEGFSTAPTGVRTTSVRADGETFDQKLHAFRETARLKPNQWLRVDLVDVARRIEVPVEDMEAQLLRWSDAGLLDHRFSGRDMLLRRVTAPDDVARGIQLWLDRFETIQTQRIDEIAAYARTSHCRHGHISTYLGGRPITHCAACDNCMVLAETPQADLPSEQEQLLGVLGCLAEAGHGWGQWSLIWILRGSSRAPEKGQRLKSFGALSFRSRSAVEGLITRLLNHKLLSKRTLSNGGVVLELTPRGQAALNNPAVLKNLLPPPDPVDQIARKGEPDEVLLARLHTWRKERAKGSSVPGFLVFHDAHLRAIAAAKPQTPEELVAVKGVGATKLAKYGDEVLEIIRTYLEEDSSIGPETP
ncbi:MAG: RecQ family ATP-dependent DNA helicase [Anaerolineae bacterium]